MNIINLTPHKLNIHNEDGDLVATVEPSGQVARCEVKRTRQPDFRGTPGVPLFQTEYGAVVDLPAETSLDSIYVVSGMTRAAVPDRVDVYQPGELLRNEQGQVVGCVGLSR
jgi:hypothetical protein